MIVCASCGEENPERARFCLACGRSLVAETPTGEERKVVSGATPVAPPVAPARQQQV